MAPQYGTGICRAKQLSTFPEAPVLPEKPRSKQDRLWIWACDYKQTRYLRETVIIARLWKRRTFRPRNKLDVSMQKHEMASLLHYFVTNLGRFRDRTLAAIYGGGDSAVDWSAGLRTNRKSTIWPRPQFGAQEHSVKQLQKNQALRILTPYLQTKLSEMVKLFNLLY